ncbi:MAG: hypothetical protein E6G67_02660 [Actinobacteria bacterium]|nr:MAG: hypothetical protein E6G67_02660 [Actinomycetota bacterium]
MNERRLRELFDAPAPGEGEAGDRAWPLVRQAHAEREPAPSRRPLRRPVIGGVALAGAAAIAVIALTPPGEAFRGWVHDRVVGEPNAKPALARLPTGGQLLVLSPRGPWIVQADGSSPRGKFVVVTSGPRLVAVTPGGTVRWSLSRPPRSADARWSPYPGYRIAYRVGDTLRVIGGNGLGDVLLARRVAPVPPAWLPRAFLHVLAYADARGRIHVVNTDTRRRLATWRLARPGPILQVAWSANGRLLAVRTATEIQIYGEIGRVSLLFRGIPAGAVLVRSLRGRFGPLEFAPRGEDFVAARRGRVLVVGARSGRARPVLTAAGSFSQTLWSPDGRWLLVAWPEADQWLFVRVRGTHRISAVSGIGREFNPGGGGRPGFPALAGWCCAAPGS